MLAPCRQRSRQNQWNRTAFWEALQRGFGPSWAERENILILFLSPYLMMRKLERFYYNWLLIKNSPLKISLLPKLCCHHQSNLNQGKKKKKIGNRNQVFKICFFPTRSQRWWRKLTLLWTSHGFVMADRSQAVIIMALEKWKKQRHIIFVAEFHFLNMMSQNSKRDVFTWLSLFSWDC